MVIDARVTRELLVALFLPEPENAVHDGAVIIKNLRVSRAGCVLPLSANAKLDKALGTRHRAAVGITEETDAVVVVVSEERGTMSLCFGGNIARDLDGATLRKALLGLFQKAKESGAQRGPAPRRASTGADAETRRIVTPAIAVAESGRPATEPVEAAPAIVPVPVHIEEILSSASRVMPIATTPSGTGEHLDEAAAAHGSPPRTTGQFPIERRDPTPAPPSVSPPSSTEKP